MVSGRSQVFTTGKVDTKMIPKVSLFIRVGQQYLKPVKAHKKYKPQYAIVDGKPTLVPTGVYYLRYKVDGKRKWECVGAELDAAMAAKSRREGKPEPKEPSTENRKPAAPTSRELAGAVKKYLDGIALRKKPKTYAAYSKALDYFKASCNKVHLDEITPDDLLQYAVDLRDKYEHSPRTVSNKFEHEMTFLKKMGVKVPIDKNDRPTFTEEDPETYEPNEFQAMFAVCTPDERLLFRFFLMTGFREQETMYVAWKNIAGGVIQVRHKPEWNWQPKAYKEREVPAHSQLIAELLAAKPAGAKLTDLIFISPGGKPDGHMLRTLKKVAKRAGLDPENCWLHKFRATFATTCLRGGADISTVQKWLGHEDLSSTMRCLPASKRPPRATRAGRNLVVARGRQIEAQALVTTKEPRHPSRKRKRRRSRGSRLRVISMVAANTGQARRRSRVQPRQDP